MFEMQSTGHIIMDFDAAASLIEWINSFHPAIVVMFGGSVGSFAPLMFDFYNNGSITKKSTVHFGFGLLAAVIVALIETIPGNGQLLFASLVAGIGGMSLVRQYASNKEEHQRETNDKIIEQAEINNQLKKTQDTLKEVSQQLGVI